MIYDWEDDAIKSYSLAIELKRERGDNSWPIRESDIMANPESVLQSNIMLRCGKEGIVLLRNNSGSLPDPKTGRYIRYGVGSPGGSDLIGWNKEGRFCAVEVKTARGRVRPEQVRFINAVRAGGGYAGIARSEEDALAICNGEIID